MFQVRFHGRGGQGVVTAAELLSLAAFADGLYAQAFPSFGSERMGAPIVAYCRIDQRQIRTHEPVDTPDAVVVQDVTLLHLTAVVAGLSASGYLVVNSSREPGDLGLDRIAIGLDPTRVAVIPAGEIAAEQLGKPLSAAALIGGIAALTGQVTLESVLQAVEIRFAGGTATGNAAAARTGFDQVIDARRGLTNVPAD